MPKNDMGMPGSLSLFFYLSLDRKGAMNQLDVPTPFRFHL